MGKIEESRLRLVGPTLLDVWKPILPRLQDETTRDVPNWPPDLFALTAFALRRESLYVRVLSAGWPAAEFADKGQDAWASFCRETARAWVGTLGTGSEPPPSAVVDRWNVLASRLDDPYLLPPSGSDPSLGLVLMELLSISDEACRYLGRTYGYDPSETDSLLPLRYTEWCLKDKNRSSMCRDIPARLLRVLPKHRTPQEGLTIRSLSLYAGLIEGSEIAPEYHQSPGKEGLCSNMLIVPWPLVMGPSAFAASKAIPGEMRNMASPFGFFTVGRNPHENDGEVVTAIRDLIKKAEQDVGPIDTVVLPEAAVSRKDADALVEMLDAMEINLIAGVGTPAEPEKRHGENFVLIAVAGSNVVQQDKQHRWKLDARQIRQYSLGSRLDPGRTWWEHIDLGSRKVAFTQTQPWLSTCVLICEDLARPDPAGDAIRAVGPSLTIALLMDGPQTRVRWGGRHATTLAEDPGCSVLTLTSLGMSQMSRPQSGQPDRSRVVALWKEEDQDFVEVELPAGKHAAVLSLTVKKCEDWAADGRNRVAAVPSLSGVRYFSISGGV
jgi:hypothetical protein